MGYQEIVHRLRPDFPEGLQRLLIEISHRKGNERPHRESSLGLMEATTSSYLTWRLRR